MYSPTHRIEKGICAFAVPRDSSGHLGAVGGALTVILANKSGREGGEKGIAASCARKR